MGCSLLGICCHSKKPSGFCWDVNWHLSCRTRFSFFKILKEMLVLKLCLIFTIRDFIILFTPPLCDYGKTHSWVTFSIRRNNYKVPEEPNKRSLNCTCLWNHSPDGPTPHAPMNNSHSRKSIVIWF